MLLYVLVQGRAFGNFITRHARPETRFFIAESDLIAQNQPRKDQPAYAND